VSLKPRTTANSGLPDKSSEQALLWKTSERLALKAKKMADVELWHIFAGYVP